MDISTVQGYLLMVENLFQSINIPAGIQPKLQVETYLVTLRLFFEGDRSMLCFICTGLSNNEIFTEISFTGFSAALDHPSKELLAHHSFARADLLLQTQQRMLMLAEHIRILSSNVRC